MAAKLFSRKTLLVLGRRLVDDAVFTGAAALSFYMTLAFFPALVVTVTLVPFLPIPGVEQAIFDFLAQGLPDEASGLVSKVVEEAIGEQRGGLLSFSLLAAGWAASTGMYGVMRQINFAYEVSEARSFMRARIVALLLSLVFGAMILTAFSLIVLGGVAQDWIGSRFGFSQLLLAFFATLRWVIIVASILLGFTLVYRFAPNVKQRLRSVAVGSVFGVVALILVSLCFSIYVRNFGDYGAMYGSIGAVVVLMLWFYAAAFVIIAGAEINALLQKLEDDPAAPSSPQ